ncbi:rhamnosyltransferase WsaF family glycosyltransferase [Methylobacterium sp. A54F]
MMFVRRLARALARKPRPGRFKGRPLSRDEVAGYFDADFYLRHNPDVAGSGQDPLDHYLRHGADEGRRITPYFDEADYLARYPDVAASGQSALAHYIRSGSAEERDPSPLFDADWYADTYADAIAPGQSPFAHFIRSGAAAGLKPNAFFDAEWYARHHMAEAAGAIAPVEHFFLTASDLHDPGPRFSISRYLAAYTSVADAPDHPLAHYLKHGRRSGLMTFRVLEHGVSSVRDAVEGAFASEVALQTYANPAAGPRVTVVTDSINAGSLFGGVATALIFASLLAKHRGAKLRVVTVREEPQPTAIAELFRDHGVDVTDSIEFRFASLFEPGLIDRAPDEIFVTTSWWTMSNTLRAVDPAQVVNLLQEDERMFYPFGDQRLRCAEVLANPAVRTVVNSRLLFEHLCETGLPHLREVGIAFEPAFSRASYDWDDAERGPRRNFFFYARPINQRNLYYRGIEAIDAAIVAGILRPQDWAFHFVGKDLSPLRLSGGVDPILHQGLPWRDYAALVRSVDLGLSLMYTPHPSYPPLDIAASGGVAVTNRFAGKTTLDQYSRNIICGDASVAGLVSALEAGVALSQDRARRRANFESQGLARDWATAFAPVLAFLDRP